MTDVDLPVYDPDEGAQVRCDEGERARPAAGEPTVVGVVLAAGTSTRFGDENKLLATIDGDPIVRLATRTLLAADLDALVVVLGYEPEAVRKALEPVAATDVTFVHNPNYESGLSSSVSSAIEAIAPATDADDATFGPGSVDAAVFLPGDMPAVAPESVERLPAAYRAGVGTALAAAYEGNRGNPVLFDRTHFPDLREIEGDVGGRSILLSSEEAALVETGDPGVVADVDTRADLRDRR